MSMAEVVVYLDEELEKLKANYERAQANMAQHPPFQIIKRHIKGHIYYYKKYWDKEQKKRISVFIGKNGSDIEAIKKQQKEVRIDYERRKEANMQRKKILPLLEKQLEIARKAYQIEGGKFL